MASRSFAVTLSRTSLRRAGAGENRNAVLFHDRAGAFFDTHGRDHFRRRADEFDARDAAHLGESRILAQEAVAGVDGIDMRNLGGTDDRRDIEIAARAFSRP